MGYAAAPPPPTTMTYGVQPLEDGNLPQPPSYGDVMNQPYPTPAPFSGTYIVNLLKYSHTPHPLRFGIMVFNATFNNNSVISWQSFLLVGEWGQRKPLTCRKLLTNFIA